MPSPFTRKKNVFPVELQLERIPPDRPPVHGEHVSAGVWHPVDPVPQVEVAGGVHGGGGEVHVPEIVVKRMAVYMSDMQRCHYHHCVHDFNQIPQRNIWCLQVR